MWDMIKDIGKGVIDFFTGQNEAEAKKKLALATEAEEERLQAKSQAISDKEWANQKSDIEEQGREETESFVEGQNAKGVLWSSMTDEGKNKITSKVATTISRSEELRAMGLDLTADIAKTQAYLNYDLPEKLGLNGNPAMDALKSGLNIASNLANFNTKSEQLDKKQSNTQRLDNIDKIYETLNA